MNAIGKIGLLVIWTLCGGWMCSSAQAANRPNAYLLSISPNQQAATLAKVVGEGCIGRSPFYMGTIASGFGQGWAMWSVRCTDHRAFAVEIKPDGSNQVLECSVLKSLHAGDCFQQFKQ